MEPHPLSQLATTSHMMMLLWPQMLETDKRILAWWGMILSPWTSEDKFNRERRLSSLLLTSQNFKSTREEPSDNQRTLPSSQWTQKVKSSSKSWIVDSMSILCHISTKILKDCSNSLSHQLKSHLSSHLLWSQLLHFLKVKRNQSGKLLSLFTMSMKRLAQVMTLNSSREYHSTARVTNNITKLHQRSKQKWNSQGLSILPRQFQKVLLQWWLLMILWWNSAATHLKKPDTCVSISLLPIQLSMSPQLLHLQSLVLHHHHLQETLSLQQPHGLSQEVILTIWSSSQVWMKWWLRVQAHTSLSTKWKKPS